MCYVVLVNVDDGESAADEVLSRITPLQLIDSVGVTVELAVVALFDAATPLDEWARRDGMDLSAAVLAMLRSFYWYVFASTDMNHSSLVLLGDSAQEGYDNLPGALVFRQYDKTTILTSTPQALEGRRVVLLPLTREIVSRFPNGAYMWDQYADKPAALDALFRSFVA